MPEFWSIAQRIVAAVLLVLSAPLWLGFAILIRGGSRGETIVRQTREGRGGAIFPDVEVADDALRRRHAPRELSG